MFFGMNSLERLELCILIAAFEGKTKVSSQIVVTSVQSDFYYFFSLELWTRLLESEEDSDITHCDSTGKLKRGYNVFVDEISLKLINDDAK